MNKKDLYLSPLELIKAYDTCIVTCTNKYHLVTIKKRALANAATNKAVKMILDEIEERGSVMEFINMHEEEWWQALKKMVED